MLGSIAAHTPYLSGEFTWVRDPRVRLTLTALLVCAAYYLGALFSFSLRVPSTRSSIIWAPNAVLLGVLVATPARTWWMWLLACLPAHLLAQARDAAPLLVLLCPFIANVVQAVIAAVAMRRFMDVPYRLETLRDMVIFIVVAVIAVPAVVSFAAAWLFVLAGWESDYWIAALARALNNVVTGLAVAPLCLAVAGGELLKVRQVQLSRCGEFAIVLFGLAGVLTVASAWESTETIRFPIRLYAPLPFLIWAAVRFRPAGLSIALLLVAYDSLSDSLAGHGVFTTGSPKANVLALEASLGALSLPLMLLAALMQERKRKEDALRESEERLARTQKFSLVMVTHTDLQGRWLKVPPTLCQLLGYSEQDLLGRHYSELTHPDDLDQNDRKRAQLVAGEIKSFDLEKRYICKGGDIVWVYINVSVVMDTHGAPVHCLSYVKDISERKRAEQALRNAVAEVHRLKEQVEADNVYLREELSETHRYGEIVGNSHAIRRVLRQAEQVAATDMTVLLLGETGTGKELVARAIHESSARKQRPLVKVNCSALPAELMESELFGHEKGAFTGATSKRVGRFEVADGGTIFLDEIGDLALSLQAKLLRVLQEGDFERLGSSKTNHVNVRVIAATNRDLSDAMRKEAFRSDLYYRLCAYPISIPPLRERKEDIRLLAEAFLREASRRLGKSFETMPRRVLEALERYDWPGNIRELQNVIERAAVTSTGGFLRLPEEWHPEPQANDAFGRTNAFELGASASAATLASLERAHILQVLSQTRWRIDGPKGAAAILGLRPSTLRSRMNKLGINRSQLN